MHPIIDRLKERKIVQWTLAYLAGAGVVYSTFSGALSVWGITDGQLKIVQVALGVGFFIALTLAWYHGERGEQKVSGVELLVLAGIIGLGAIGVQLVTVGPGGAVDGTLGGAVVRMSVSGLSRSHPPSTEFHLGPSTAGFVHVGPDETFWYQGWSDRRGVPIEGASLLGAHRMSPDGTHLAQFADGGMLLHPLPSGVTQRLADGVTGQGIRWGDDGYIYFSNLATGRLNRVPEAGGRLEEVGPDRANDGPRLSDFTPVGRSGDGLFMALGETARVEAYQASSRERTALVDAQGYELVGTEYLVFATSDGLLRAAPFDRRSLSLTAEPTTIAEDLLTPRNRLWSSFGLSRDGTLAYWTDNTAPVSEFVWVTQDGEVSQAAPGWTFDFGTGNTAYSLSPDDSSVAARLRTQAGYDIFLKHFEGGPARRLTFGEREDRDPKWFTADSLTYLSTNEPDSHRASRHYHLVKTGTDGRGAAVSVPMDLEQISEGLFNPLDGHSVVRTSGPAGQPGGRDIIRVEPSGTVSPLFERDADDQWMSVSPDGDLLVFQSNESGVDQIYIARYPDPSIGVRLQVSEGYGTRPQWSRDGREVFYVGAGNSVTAATVSREGGLRITSVRELFRVPEDIIPDIHTTPGERGFLMVRNLPSDAELVVVFNFFEELRRLVPS